MSTLTEAVDKFRAYNLQSTNAEENLWSRGTFMKSALAGAAGSLIAGFDIGHASPVLLRKMISHVEHGWPNLWIPIHGSRWKVHPPDQVFKA